jgi:hypothetical protein
MQKTLMITMALVAVAGFVGCARKASVDTVLSAPGKYADRVLVSRELKLVSPTAFGFGLAASVTTAEKSLVERGIEGVTGVPALTPAGKRIELFLDLHDPELVAKVQKLCSAGVEEVVVHYRVRIGPGGVGDTERVTLANIRAKG